jgi:2-methylisocitrate lyase-like PEP mutase family enzyme
MGKAGGRERERRSLTKRVVIRRPLRAAVLMNLHGQPHGFVMPNAWDGLSALLLKDAGFQALGTSSAALALSLGRLDGASGQPQ